MKKILLVFGTRPEAIKMAPLVKKFQQYPERFETKVCVTAQHRQMLDQVLSLFEIVPDFDLDIMSQGQDLYDVTSRVLLGMRDVFNKFQPDVVLVHGDTATSTSAALAAFYKQIPVGHVEAGLRTYNIYSPWPEEMNRQLTGRIATYHFAPTSLSQSHLLSEKVDAGSIFVTGNTVIDALQLVRKKIGTDAELAKEQEDFIASKGLPALFEKWRSQERKLILVTGHRRENFGDGFLRICKALKTIAQKYPDADIVYPVHLNPNVQKPVYEILVGQSNIYLIDPLEYLPFVYLMSLSFFVLTDSGGIQEEAPGLGKPVLVMRDTTERPEAVEAGTVLLVGTDTELIVSKASQLINEPAFYQTMSKAVNPYGDGLACQRIVDLLS